MEQPQILQIGEQKKKEVQIANSSAWGSLAADDDDSEEEEAGGAGKGEEGKGELWTQFQRKDEVNKQREEEKRREEERARQRKVEEAEQKKREEEESERLREQREREEKEAAEQAEEEERKQREAQREAEKAKRESMQQTVNMDSGRMIAKDVGSNYMGLNSISGLNLADLRGGGSDSEDSSDDSD